MREKLDKIDIDAARKTGFVIIGLIVFFGLFFVAPAVMLILLLIVFALFAISILVLLIYEMFKDGI